jgi:hypothetical protein
MPAREFNLLPERPRKALPVEFRSSYGGHGKRDILNAAPPLEGARIKTGLCAGAWISATLGTMYPGAAEKTDKISQPFRYPFTVGPGFAYIESNMRASSSQACEKSFARSGVETAGMKVRAAKPAARLVLIHLRPSSAC